MALIPPGVGQQHYGIPTTQLARWQRQGTGPDYFSRGPRSIRYYPADIDDWLPQNQHQGGHVGKHVDEVVLAGNNCCGSAAVRWNG